MTASKFKDDMCNIGGITYKRMTKGCYFLGLRVRVEEDNNDTEE